MQNVQEKSTDTLKELIIINNDRFEGYKTAAQETQDSDLQSLFTRLSLQSRGYSNDLRQLVPFTDEAPDRDETKVSGKIYRIWMDVKAALTAKNRKGILSSCEFGEDVALKTYNDVLKDTSDISPDLLALIRKQRDEIKQEHDNVRQLRDRA